MFIQHTKIPDAQASTDVVNQQFSEQFEKPKQIGKRRERERKKIVQRLVSKMRRISAFLAFLACKIYSYYSFEKYLVQMIWISAHSFLLLRR